MNTYPIEVFKAGTHTANNGMTKTYSVADLEAIVATYNGQTDRKAPLVLGHPDLDSPAYGWVESLAMKGEKMIAHISQVQDKVKEAVKAGMFKTVSIALFADNILRHIGLLGAAPPAVAGLAPVQFAVDTEFVEYAWATDEWRMPTVASLMRGIRDFVIAKFDLATADSVLPSDQIDRLTDSASSTYIPDDDVAKALYSQKQKEEEQMEIKELEDKFTQLEMQFTALKTESDGLKTLLAETQNEVVLAKTKGVADLASVEFAGFVDNLIRDGKVLPAEKESLASEFTDTFKANSQLSFAAGEATLIEKFKARLSARPIIVKMPDAAFATHKDAPVIDLKNVPVTFAAVAQQIDAKSMELDAQINAYAAEHQVSYEVAAKTFGAGM
jgi:hypothetical protein